MLKRIVVAAIALVVLAAATVPAQAQSRRHRTSSRCDRYDRYGNCDDRNDRSYGSRSSGSNQNYWLRRGVQRTRNVVTDIMDDGDRAMSDIDRRYPRSQHRPIIRADRYDPMRVRRVPLGPYVWGRRYPFDSCGYSWNRNGCRDYQGIRDLIMAGVQTVETERLRRELHELNRNLESANRKEELEAIDDTYGTEEREVEVINQDRQEPVRQARDERPAPQRIETLETGSKPVTLINMAPCGAHINGEPIPVNGHTTIADRSKRIFVEVDDPSCNKYLDPIADGVIALKCH